MSMPVLLRRLHEVSTALTVAGFDHAVGGALALAVHAEPRFTADIDLNVIADADHPEPLLAALPSDLEPLPEAADQLRATGQVRFHWADPNTPLDLFLPQHPTFHAQVAKRAVPYRFADGVTVKVITATDLLIFKTLFGRSKDFVDIETLGEHGAGDLDEARSWVQEILGDGSAAERRLVEAWTQGQGSQA
ncbi:hypothetical protein [Nocardioides yefusunii]|uniref:Nucleotidyltransferase AbiEii toxin of type IV toxin-antitoxin system n=1 Tax=Nocardioides yefusunii TaxID=2500546 RepID=A0ABW1QU57_9ACTN|nr:hypothetical protein [Nocardioides yefusunii]